MDPADRQKGDGALGYTFEFTKLAASRPSRFPRAQYIFEVTKLAAFRPSRFRLFSFSCLRFGFQNRLLW
jgi:hypothetical protein